MGYNGGINKRGYYRRNHGMYKKSSYRTGERLLGNIFSGGIGLLSLLADTGDARKSISYSKSWKSDLYIPKISTIDDSIINKITTNLQVINISADKFKCFDFEKKECYIYTREELLLA